MIQQTAFGKTKAGESVELYTLTNANGLVAKVMTYGAILTELHVPDHNGKLADIVLGFDNFAAYEAGHPFFGAIAGRVANRIAGAKFSLNGVEYKLAANNGPNAIHGGRKGFDKYVWKARPVDAAGSPGVELSHLSPDGDEGYPGNLDIRVIYTLTDRDELRIEYFATTDKPTPVNLTNHSYYNLAGAGSGDVLGHLLRLNADHYTPSDPALIPTGQIAPVAGTVWDFTAAKPIGKDIAATGPGYDHNFVLNQNPVGALKLCAVVEEPTSGRIMEVHTTEPGVQLYTGNYLNGPNNGIGGPYKKHYAFCLETQHFPDSVHRGNFPSTILLPGMIYMQTTLHRFSRK